MFTFDQKMNALRNAVAPQTIAEKKRLFKLNPICAITGETLNWENCHLDHYEPKFIELVGPSL